VGNLLGNAAKFTPPGGRVDVVVSRDGSSVTIAVYDTGVGLAPEVRSLLFEPFTQAPQTLDRTMGGLGLGLAMVRGLVELHGGTAKASSGGPGQGSEFTVRLPLVEAPAQPAPSVEPHAGARHRVLVIEDNVDSADSLRLALEIGGHEVQVAYEGRAALALARSFQPDVIICDIGLPGMNGYAVAHALRADSQLRPPYLIALSGYAQAEDLRLAQEAGFDHHLAKPASIAMIERVMAGVPAAAAAAAV
jgi:two-component system CheB/CheR fusion protein